MAILLPLVAPAPDVPPRSRRRLDRLAAALFVAALAVPTVARLPGEVNAASIEKTERRRAAAFPDLPRTAAEIAGYPHALEAWHDDGLGLREGLLRAQFRLAWEGLGAPMRNMEHGTDGWNYFLGNRSLEIHRGVVPFTPADLGAWTAHLARKRDELARIGVRYLYVVCPNKETIYPEHLPARWSALGPTRLEQLAAEPGPDSPFLDLRPALLAEKQRDRPEDYVYARRGTHWNGRGGWAAYERIADRLEIVFQDLPRVRREDLVRDLLSKDSDALAPGMVRADQEQLYHLVPAEPAAVLVEGDPASRARRLRTRRADGRGPRVLLYHDSFGPYVERLLRESASEMLAIAAPAMVLDEVRDERPDVVIELYVERTLGREAPGSP